MNTIKKQNVDEKFKMILNYLVKERQRQKISQNEIANLLEIKRETFSKIEAGKQKMTAQQMLQLVLIYYGNIQILEGFFTNPEKLDCDKTELLLYKISTQQKHIEDCHILLDQQQRIIEKLTSREG